MWNSLSDPVLTTTASGCSAPEPWLLPGCSSVYDSLVRYEILLQRGGGQCSVAETAPSAGRGFS